MTFWTCVCKCFGRVGVQKNDVLPEKQWISRNALTENYVVVGSEPLPF